MNMAVPWSVWECDFKTLVNVKLLLLETKRRWHHSKNSLFLQHGLKTNMYGTSQQTGQIATPGHVRLRFMLLVQASNLMFIDSKLFVSTCSFFPSLCMYRMTMIVCLCCWVLSRTVETLQLDPGNDMDFSQSVLLLTSPLLGLSVFQASAWRGRSIRRPSTRQPCASAVNRAWLDRRQELVLNVKGVTPAGSADGSWLFEEAVTIVALVAMASNLLAMAST